MEKFRRSDRVESALISGLACGALSGAGVLAWYLPLIAIVFLFGIFRKYAFVAAVAAVAAGFSLAYCCKEHYEQQVAAISSESYEYGEFTLILNDSRQSRVKNIGAPAMYHAHLTGYRLRDDDKSISCSYRVMVKLPDDIGAPDYGTVIRGRGAIADSSSPGFANYMKAHGFVKCVYLETADVAGTQESLMGRILRVRDFVASRVLDAIPGDNSRNLAAALFFGITGGLNSGLRSVYVDTGTIHIFSVSGMHVAVLACFLYAILRFAGARTGYLLTLLLTGMYVISTGANAPAVRAYMMLFLWGMCRICKVWMTPFSVFCWASSLLLLCDPLLVYDMGARYSVVITGVLIACGEKIIRGSRKEQIRRKYLVSGARPANFHPMLKMLYVVRAPLLICTAAFFGGLAISLHHNGQFLILSIVANLLLSPFVSLFYILLGIAMIYPPGAYLLSEAFNLLHIFCSFFSKLSFNVPAVSPSAFELWLYVALLFCFLRCRAVVKISAAILLSALVLRWVILPYTYAPELWIYNSYRHPACIALIDSSRNSAVVIDPSSGSASAKLVEHLRRVGVNKIACAAFSRNSIYTARGLRTLCRLVPVETLLLPQRKRYERWRRFYAYLDDCDAAKGVKRLKNSKKVKIISQKHRVTLEYFKRRATLKDVFVLKEQADGRELIIDVPGYRRIVDTMPFDSSRRIYRYELAE
ncbi:MAG: ComEC/Rec2 family competence protein [Lentisphaeria bacterium]|nr:ComEC/Rec2 family competence protein [Lentisphaeria bacterium]